MRLSRELAASGAAMETSGCQTDAVPLRRLQGASRSNLEDRCRPPGGAGVETGTQAEIQRHERDPETPATVRAPRGRPHRRRPCGRDHRGPKRRREHAGHRQRARARPGRGPDPRSTGHLSRGPPPRRPLGLDRGPAGGDRRRGGAGRDPLHLDPPAGPTPRAPIRGRQRPCPRHPAPHARGIGPGRPAHRRTLRLRRRPRRGLHPGLRSSRRRGGPSRGCPALHGAGFDFPRGRRLGRAQLYGRRRRRRPPARVLTGGPLGLRARGRRRNELHLRPGRRPWRGRRGAARRGLPDLPFGVCHGRRHGRRERRLHPAPGWGRGERRDHGCPDAADPRGHDLGGGRGGGSFAGPPGASGLPFAGSGLIRTLPGASEDHETPIFVRAQVYPIEVRGTPGSVAQLHLVPAAPSSSTSRALPGRPRRGPCRRRRSCSGRSPPAAS